MRRLFSHDSNAVVVLALVITGSSWAGAQGTSIVGTWDLTIESPQGKRTNTFTVKQEGEKLTGVLKSPRGERPVDNLALKGNEVSFSMTISFQGNDMIISYKGSFENDAMKGQADFGGMATGDWSAVRHQEGAPSASTAAAPSPGAEAMDISGVWNFNVETPAGSGSPTFTFKQEGEKVTGTYKGQLGTADVTGTMKGRELKFSFKVDFQGQAAEITYEGKVEDKDNMKGTAKLGDIGEATWTAKRQQ